MAYLQLNNILVYNFLSFHIYTFSFQIWYYSHLEVATIAWG